MNKKAFILIVALSIVLSLIIVNCSERIVHGDNHIIRAGFKIGSGEAISNLAQFLLTVTAEDFTEPLTTTLQLEGDSLIGEITVPAGPRRTFTIEALDTLGNTVYSGSTTVDLAGGEPIELDISIAPVVPVLVFTPRYIEVEMGMSFALDVSVHNAEGLAFLEFDLDFNSVSGTINSPTISPAATLDSSVGLSYGTGETYSTIWVSFTSGSPGLIVDSTGSAELARLSFETHSDTNIELDSAYITIPRVDAMDTLENTIPGIFTDRALIVLEQIPF